MLAHIIVSGHVQGVGFRYFVQYGASKLQLTGWVRNKDDGTVEIKVQGEEETIDNFVDQIKKGFHRLMRVDHVEITKYHQQRDYTNFQIRS